MRINAKWLERLARPRVANCNAIVMYGGDAESEGLHMAVNIRERNGKVCVCVCRRRRKENSERNALDLVGAEALSWADYPNSFNLATGRQ